MRVAVVGCGLAGLTTAWFLRERGADVVVLERAAGPARETSFANGSMITPSLANPWNSPGVTGALLGSIGREQSPMLLRLSALPSLISWGWQFLRHSTRPRFEHSFLANARLARYSQSVMRQLLQQQPLEFEHAPVGTVQVFTNSESLGRGRATAEWLAQTGVTHRVLDRDALMELEPALAAADRYAGGIYYPDDEVGNARLFCEQLWQRAAAAGIDFQFETAVSNIARNRGRVEGVTTTRGTIAADHFVLAAGSFSWPLGNKFGVTVPVRPAKGYSLTVPLGRFAPRPRYAIVDDILHAAVVPLGGDRLRVAGTAEFAGFDTHIAAARIANLKSLLRAVYPDFSYADNDVEAWCGLRPMTPDGRPLIGPTRVENLWLNTGHGPLGWTLACASGRIIADMIYHDRPELDVTDFSPARF